MLRVIRHSIAALVIATVLPVATGGPAHAIAPGEIIIAAPVGGYHGIWYENGPTSNAYGYKYSGGMATFTSSHMPLAIYAPEADRTFFVYGGACEPGDPDLAIMAACFDHSTGLFSQPRMIFKKPTDPYIRDAHHNPIISIDSDGYVWVMTPAHGGIDGHIFRSQTPYSIESFECVAQKEFSYPQLWRLNADGFLFLFTKYTAGRELYMTRSSDGVEWSADRKLAGFGGHYQISTASGAKCGTAFNWHPPVGGLNARTNLYYMETTDFGETWTNAAGEELACPLDEVHNDALVRDYQSEGYLVYLIDMAYDDLLRPVILYVITRGYRPGPQNGPRWWKTARWTGTRWEISTVTASDHDYDTGSLYIEPNWVWRVIGPTEPAQQGYVTGGEIAVWQSIDRGKTWTRTNTLTWNSQFNHSFVRKPVNAHRDFYAFWADGDALEQSDSHLYVADRDCSRVWMLPEHTDSAWTAPAEFSTTHIPPSVSITGPTVWPGYYTIDSLVTLSGTASTDTSSVTWSNQTTGTSGVCEGTTRWTAAVALADGANMVSVTAHRNDGESSSDTISFVHAGDALPLPSWCYVMTSLPIVPAKPNPKWLTGLVGELWFAWDQSDQRYVRYPDTAAMLTVPEQTIGRGFWAVLGNSARLRGSIPPQDHEVIIELRAGWNLVGAPFLSPSPWNSSAIAVEYDNERLPLADCMHLVNPVAFGWDSLEGRYFTIGEGRSQHELQPWNGYWVWAYAKCSLVIPPVVVSP